MNLLYFVVQTCLGLTYEIRLANWNTGKVYVGIGHEQGIITFGSVCVGNGRKFVSYIYICADS